MKVVIVHILPLIYLDFTLYYIYCSRVFVFSAALDKKTAAILNMTWSCEVFPQVRQPRIPSHFWLLLLNDNWPISYEITKYISILSILINANPAVLKSAVPKSYARVDTHALRFVGIPFPSILLQTASFTGEPFNQFVISHTTMGRKGWEDGLFYMLKFYKKDIYIYL